ETTWLNLALAQHVVSDPFSLNISLSTCALALHRAASKYKLLLLKARLELESAGAENCISLCRYLKPENVNSFQQLPACASDSNAANAIDDLQSTEDDATEGIEKVKAREELDALMAGCARTADSLANTVQATISNPGIKARSDGNSKCPEKKL